MTDVNWQQVAMAAVVAYAIYTSFINRSSHRDPGDSTMTSGRDVQHEQKLLQKLETMVELLRTQADISRQTETTVSNGNRELKQILSDAVKQLKVMNSEIQTQTELTETLSVSMDTAVAKLKLVAAKLLENPTSSGSSGGKSFQEEYMQFLSNSMDKFVPMIISQVLKQPRKPGDGGATSTGAANRRSMFGSGLGFGGLGGLGQDLDDDDDELWSSTVDSRPSISSSSAWSSSSSSLLSSTSPMLLLGCRYDIRSVNPRSGQQAVIWKEGIHNVVAVDFDAANKAIFWTDVASHNITRAVLDHNGNVRIRQAVVTYDVLVPDGVAYDWVHKNLYWTDTGSDSIEVLGLRDVVWVNYHTTYHEVFRRRTLFDSDLTEPRGVAVDPRPRNRMLYWTDWGNPAKIERSSLDGSGRQIIVNKDIIWPNGLTLDLESNRLFWVDAKLFSIFSSDLDGQNRRVVIKSHEYLNHPFSIAISDGGIYWTDWQSQSVMKASVSSTGMTSSAVSRVSGGVFIPYDVKIVDSSKQPYYADVCAESGCSHICLPTTRNVAGFTCSCPTGVPGYTYTLDTDQRTCIQHKLVELLATLAEGKYIAAATILDDEIYVIRGGSTNLLEIYDADTWSLLRRLSITGLSQAIDMTSSSRHNCIYIADNAGNYVFRLTGDRKLSKWPTSCSPIRLSVTTNYNVLVTCQAAQKVNEYTTTGQLVREIRPQSNITYLWHAIELSADNYVISYGHKKQDDHKVCFMNSLGEVRKCYGSSKGTALGQLSAPVYMVHVDDYILVANVDGEMIVRLRSSNLSYSGTLENSVDLEGPYTMSYDPAMSQLLVVDNTWVGSWWTTGRVKLYQLNFDTATTTTHQNLL